jgi:hypothetical protein
MVGPFAVGLATWFTLTVLTAHGQSAPSPKSFVVFDGTLYSDKPDLFAYGIRPITMAYAGKFGPDWYKNANHLPDLQAVQNVAREAQQKGSVVVLDIEHWPLQGSPDSVRDSLAKYITVLEWFREAGAGLSVGYYGAPPLREHRSWMAENDEVSSLASAVDVLFPSLYTFYPDQAGWKKYAIAQIEEARRYGKGKPVYVFLWPQYHESNRILGGQYLPTDYWLLELETAKQYADGIVIWGGWGSDNRPAKWDDQALWWGKTKEFMETLRVSRVSPPTSVTVR